MHCTMYDHRKKTALGGHRKLKSWNNYLINNLAISLNKSKHVIRTKYPPTLAPATLEL